MRVGNHELLKWTFSQDLATPTPFTFNKLKVLYVFQLCFIRIHDAIA
jgi:hypothetical protein